MNHRKRLISSFLDHLIMSCIFVPIMWLIDLHSHNGTLAFGIGMLVYANKDCVQGKSPAKRLLGLMVVDPHSKLAAGSGQCFIRNITILIWPIEVVMLLINPARRLGDYLAGTECVECSRQADNVDLAS
ncbi:RDD family protein [Hymenobacter ruber]